MATFIHKKLRPLQLAAVIFLTVSGGPYGLEPLLSYAGAHASLLLLLITPFLWDMPTLLTVLELNSMMPVTGGYYQWVKKAMGIRWAFYEGWWTWLYTVVDLAIYPVLFVQYAMFFFPQLMAYKIPVCLLIIWSCAFLNIRGIVSVGKSSLILTIAVLSPFVVLFIMTLLHPRGDHHLVALSFSGTKLSSIGMSLYIIMWNFLGWDNATTYAGEVVKPARSYLISVAIAFCTVFVVYFMTIFAAQTSGIGYQYLSDNGFPSLGEFIAGHWLGAFLAAGGMASTVGMFSAVLLSVSRVPQVMAEDGLFPKKLQALHPKYKTPYVSILLLALLVSCMVIWTFTDLIIIDVSLYGAGLILEFISLLILRRKYPQQNRPFRIPLRFGGLCILIALPVTVFLFALLVVFQISVQRGPVLFAAAALISAWPTWWLISYLKKSGAYS